MLWMRYLPLLFTTHRLHFFGSLECTHTCLCIWVPHFESFLVTVSFHSSLVCFILSLNARGELFALLNT
ncbi:unnamed protein product [Phytomonas sp. EM1]|nr:unnamed protein product [Phytomonas sp. EM1]|eukprot:CCW62153.1 unnamed protein product [Phytomonas sp. isolate EM1]